MTLTQDIVKEDGTPFAKQGVVALAIKNKGLNPKEFNIVPVDGGYVGRSKELPKTRPGDNKRLAWQTAKKIRVRVHRSNIDPDNKDLPISVCVNSRKSRRVFAPGEVVELLPAQISVLKNSVDEVQLPVPFESGVYESANPIQVARNLYPSMTPELDNATGQITMVRRTPNYLIEYLDDPTE